MFFKVHFPYFLSVQKVFSLYVSPLVLVVWYYWNEIIFYSVFLCWLSFNMTHSGKHIKFHLVTCCYKGEIFVLTTIKKAGMF